MTEIDEITRLLQDIGGKNSRAVDELLPLVYDNLRRLAGKHLQGERPDHTLNATALVHEAYIKLVDQERVTWQNRAHFFAIAAQAMRRILINYARDRMAEKRGGNTPPITLNEEFMSGEMRSAQLIDLDDALAELARKNSRQAKIVEYRFFGGLTEDEIAEVMDFSIATVKRDWRFARAWLARELREDSE